MSVQRLEPPYENKSHAFYRSDHSYNRQYFYIYESRLRQLGSLIRENISEKYGE